MAPNVNWKGLEEIGETRILDALRLALNGTSMADIARETGIPASSLSSIKCHRPYAHRNKQQSAPAKNWIPTVVGKAWFPYFRLYGPTEAFFNRTWKLPTIEKMR